MSASLHEIPAAGKFFRGMVGMLAGLLLAYALASAMVISHAWRDYQRAGRVAAINEATDDLVRLARHVRLESERVASLLGKPGVIGPADRAFMDAQRRNSGSALHGAAELISRQDIPGAAEVARRLREQHAALRNQNIAIDAALSQPLAERPPRLAEERVAAARQLLADAEGLLDAAAREAAYSDGQLGHALEAKLMAWKLQGAAWSELANLEAILRRPQKPGQQELESIAMSAARTATAWEYLARMEDGFRDRQFDSALIAARTGYFEDFGKVRDRMVQAMRSGAAVAGREAYLAVSVRAMEAIGSVLNAAMDLAGRQASGRTDAARNHLAALAAALLAGLALLSYVLSAAWRQPFAGIASGADAERGAERTLPDQHALHATLLDGVMADVRERARAEEELRRTRDQLQAILGNAPVVIYYKDLDGRLLTANRPAEELPLPQSEDGGTIDQAAAAPAAGRLQANERRVLETNQPLQVEEVVLHEDGPHTYISTKFPLRDAGGNIYGICGISTDITDRKRIEAALRESEERFRQFSESVNIGFWILDLNPRRVVYVNRAFTRMSGLEADEVYRKPGPGVDVVHEDDRPRVKQVFEEWLRGDPASCLEIDYRIVRPDGKVRWIHDHGVRLQDAKGETFRILGISEDITDRKRADEAIKAMNRALERKAGELATANQELEAFAYSVSHDLRAPLRHVDGYINLLQKSAGPALDETSRRYLDTISKAAARMACLIDDLLAFSRMGRTDLARTTVPLGGMIASIINDLRAESGSRRIEWVVKPLPEVFGDAALIRQAFFNLLENAVKYTRPRERARIEIDCVPGGEEEAVIVVSDNGVGFDMKYVDKLFGVFQRLHRMEEFEGTGIGLASVMRIIQRHGGRVWAVSEKGKGSAFYVAIPLKERMEND